MFKKIFLHAHEIKKKYLWLVSIKININNNNNKNVSSYSNIYYKQTNYQISIIKLSIF